MKHCLLCQKEFTPSKFDDGRQKFCCSKHQQNYWCKQNQERVKLIRKKTKEKHKKQIKEYNRKWHIKNKERNRVRLLAWRRKNKAKVVQQVLLKRYREKGLIGSYTIKEWECLKEKYGQRCAICQKKKKLTRDHIIPVTKNGTNYISNIQPLCRQCNSRKFNHILSQKQ